MRKALGRQQPSQPFKMNAIKFTVRENDELFPICHMSSHEAAAIEECIQELVPDSISRSYWFEVDMSPEVDTDEDVPYGVLACLTHNPKPLDWKLKNLSIPHPFPKGLLKKLSGKTFVVNPVQYGVNPWGKKVEIVFETLGDETVAPAEKVSESHPVGLVA